MAGIKELSLPTALATPLYCTPDARLQCLISRVLRQVWLVTVNCYNSVRQSFCRVAGNGGANL